LRASVAQALKRLELGRQPFRRLGEGRLFESLREWVPGDDLRHIDWKATARRRKVITRQYEAERRQQVLLVLDTGRLMTAEVTAGAARIDFAVQAALELAYAAAQYDDNVGIMTFADGVQHFVAPERGRTGVRRILDVLAVVQPRLVEPDYPGAFRYRGAQSQTRADRPVHRRHRSLRVRRARRQRRHPAAPPPAARRHAAQSGDRCGRDAATRHVARRVSQSGGRGAVACA